MPINCNLSTTYNANILVTICGLCLLAGAKKIVKFGEYNLPFVFMVCAVHLVSKYFVG